MRFYRFCLLSSLVLLVLNCSREDSEPPSPVNFVASFDIQDSTIVVANDSYSLWRLRDTTWFQVKYALCSESLGLVDSLRSLGPGELVEIDGLLAPNSCLRINTISNHCELRYSLRPYNGTIEAEWIFIGFLNDGIFEYPPCEPLKITTLIVEKKNDEPNSYSVRGVARNNGYAASVDITDDELEVSCCFRNFVGGSEEEADFETRYWQGLDNSSQYAIEDNNLQLINTETGESLFFIRREYD